MPPSAILSDPKKKCWTRGLDSNEIYAPNTLVTAIKALKLKGKKAASVETVVWNLACFFFFFGGGWGGDLPVFLSDSGIEVWCEPMIEPQVIVRPFSPPHWRTIFLFERRWCLRAYISGVWPFSCLFHIRRSNQSNPNTTNPWLHFNRLIQRNVPMESGRVTPVQLGPPIQRQLWGTFSGRCLKIFDQGWYTGTHRYTIFAL